MKKTWVRSLELKDGEAAVVCSVCEKNRGVRHVCSLVLRSGPAMIRINPAKLKRNEILYLHVRCCGGGRVNGDIKPITSKDGNIGNCVGTTGDPLPPDFVPVGRKTLVLAVER